MEDISSTLLQIDSALAVSQPVTPLRSESEDAIPRPHSHSRMPLPHTHGKSDLTHHAHHAPRSASLIHINISSSRPQYPQRLKPLYNILIHIDQPLLLKRLHAPNPLNRVL